MLQVIDKEIEKKIYTVRGLQVMLDSDLAELYGVETKQLNKAVKRNINRFPDSFRFQLTQDEYNVLRSQSAVMEERDELRFQNGTSNDDVNLRSQIVISSSKHGGRRYLPYVFTEQGVAMLSAVLRSETAIKMSIQIINAFIEMRKLITHNAGLFQRVGNLEQKQLQADTKFEKIFEIIESREVTPKQGIFFDGQVFDAYVFVSDLIKSAERSIVLIDNYVDESVLTLFSKNAHDIRITILTKNISKALKLDVEKYNAQYPEIELKQFSDAHDRFLIIDDDRLYHFGASLKDLGKKWFAFSRFERDALQMLEAVKGLRK